MTSLLAAMAGSSRHVSTGNFVKETTFTEASTAGTAVITPNNAIGNLLVLHVALNTTTITTTVADTGGNTWNLIQTDASYKSCQYYSLTTAVSGTLTVTFSGAVSAVLSCLEFNNIPSSPLDVHIEAHGSSTAPATGTSSATAQADEIVVAFVCNAGANVYSGQTGGYTVRPILLSTASTENLQSAYQILSSTGTQSYGLTLGTSHPWTAMLATFKRN